MNQILGILTCIFLLVSGHTAIESYATPTSNDDSYCDRTGWVAYRDEKCFKLIKKWATRDEAKAICAQDSSQLVLIKNVDEQKYLTEFVFETSQVNFNFWIGAKRLSVNTSKFVWEDGSEMYFANWDQAYPTEDMRRGCVVMQSDLTRNAVNIKGKWRDVICDLVNYVVCQKFPIWSIRKLQKTFLEQRNKQIVTENELEATKNELSATKTKLTQTKNRLTNVESNPEPQTLWPSVQWKNVTSEYAGLFFRAEGGGSAQFETVQAENSPRLTEVRLKYWVGYQSGLWWETYMNVGNWSTGIGVFGGSWNGVDGHTHQFFQSGGEVRPRNMAMHIWKRT